MPVIRYKLNGFRYTINETKGNREKPQKKSKAVHQPCFSKKCSAKLTGRFFCVRASGISAAFPVKRKNVGEPKNLRACKHDRIPNPECFYTHAEFWHILPFFSIFPHAGGGMALRQQGGRCLPGKWLQSYLHRKITTSVFTPNGLLLFLPDARTQKKRPSRSVAPYIFVFCSVPRQNGAFSTSQWSKAPFCCGTYAAAPSCYCAYKKFSPDT